MKQEINIFGFGSAGMTKSRYSILSSISALKTAKFGWKKMQLIYALLMICYQPEYPKPIATQAKKIKLVLSKGAVEYLAEAIGNDMTRAATELRKLYIYGKGRQLELAEVKELVPCQTQNSLQLASAIRQGESNQVLHLLDDLLSRSEPLMVIVATLLTQFRTWLWVKSAMSATGYAYVSGVKKDSELAQLCSISNLNRIYYLRQEVANTSINALTKAVTMMLDLEISIKRGADSGAVASHRASSKDLLLIILSVSRLFKLT